MLKPVFCFAEQELESQFHSVQLVFAVCLLSSKASYEPLHILNVKPGIY